VTVPPGPGPPGPARRMSPQAPAAPQLPEQAEQAEPPGDDQGSGCSQPSSPIRPDSEVTQMSRRRYLTAAAAGGSCDPAARPQATDCPREPESAPRDATPQSRSGPPATGAVVGFIRRSWARKTPPAP